MKIQYWRPSLTLLLLALSGTSTAALADSPIKIASVSLPTLNNLGSSGTGGWLHPHSNVSTQNSSSNPPNNSGAQTTWTHTPSNGGNQITSSNSSSNNGARTTWSHTKSNSSTTSPPTHSHSGAHTHSHHGISNSTSGDANNWISPSAGSPQHSANAASTPANGPINLDLSSTQASKVLSHLPGSNPIDIQVGGQEIAVTSSTELTPAETLATFQVLRTGQQSLDLGSLGNAVGGTIVLNQHLSQALSDLVIPMGVTVIDKVNSSNPTLKISNDLTNDGNLYVVSPGRPATNSTAGITISAANIYNEPGAIISTVLPQSGLLGYNNSMNSVNLTLSAANNIVNQGSIASSGNLTLSAGGSIVNALPAGVSSPSPLIQAANNVNLQSANITNSGSIIATAGNINISSRQDANIAVNNAGGQISAPAGVINVRNAAYVGNSGFSLLGGQVRAEEVNINSGQGQIDFDTDQIDAVVNAVGGAAVIGTTSGNLTLGNIELSGDPLIFNLTSSVTLSGNLNVGTNPLSILAGGNIVTGTNSSDIVADQLNVIAGANLAQPGGVGTPVIWSDGGMGNNGGSVTGGSIDFTQGTPITSITISSSGQVAFLAFNPPGGTTGQIILPTNSEIDTAGPVGFYSEATASGAQPGIQFGNIGTITGTGGVVIVNQLFAPSATTNFDATTGAPNRGVLYPVVTGSPANAANIVGGNIVANNGMSVPVEIGVDGGISSNGNITIGNITATGTVAVASSVAAAGGNVTVGNISTVRGINLGTPNGTLGLHNVSSGSLTSTNSTVYVFANTVNLGFVTVPTTPVGNLEAGNEVGTATGNILGVAAGVVTAGYVDPGITIGPLPTPTNTTTMTTTTTTVATTVTVTSTTGTTTTTTLTSYPGLNGQVVVNTGTGGALTNVQTQTILNNILPIPATTTISVYNSLQPTTTSASTSQNAAILSGLQVTTGTSTGTTSQTSTDTTPTTTTTAQPTIDNTGLTTAQINVRNQLIQSLGVLAQDSTTDTDQTAQDPSYYQSEYVNNTGGLKTSVDAIMAQFDTLSAQQQATIGNLPPAQMEAAILNAVNTADPTSITAITNASAASLPNPSSFDNYIIGLYKAATGSLPDPQTFANLEAQLTAGLNPAQLEQGIGAVPAATAANIAAEIFAGDPSLSNSSPTALVKTLYQNAFGIVPSAAELVFYTTLLQSGISPATLIQEFGTNPELQKNLQNLTQALAPLNGEAAQQIMGQVMNLPAAQRMSIYKLPPDQILPAILQALNPPSTSTPASSQQSQTQGTSKAIRLLQRPAVSLTNNTEPESVKTAEAALPGVNAAAPPSAPLAGGIEFNLNPGAVLVLRKAHEVTVRTSAGQARCAKGASALFFDNGRQVAIFCFDGNGSGDVTITVGSTRLSVFPGTEIVVTKDQSSRFDQVNPDCGIDYKQPHVRQLDDGTRVWTADINVVTALASLKPLRKMSASDDEGDQKIVRQLLKSSVILSKL